MNVVELYSIVKLRYRYYLVLSVIFSWTILNCTCKSQERLSYLCENPALSLGETYGLIMCGEDMFSDFLQSFGSRTYFESMMEVSCLFASRNGKGSKPKA